MKLGPANLWRFAGRIEAEFHERLHDSLRQTNSRELRPGVLSIRSDRSQRGDDRPRCGVLLVCPRPGPRGESEPRETERQKRTHCRFGWSALRRIYSLAVGLGVLPDFQRIELFLEDADALKLSVFVETRGEAKWRIKLFSLPINVGRTENRTVVEVKRIRFGFFRGVLFSASKRRWPVEPSFQRLPRRSQLFTDPHLRDVCCQRLGVARFVPLADVRLAIKTLPIFEAAELLGANDDVEPLPLLMCFFALEYPEQ